METDIVVDSTEEEQTICCWTPKKWTRFIGWLQIILCCAAAVVGIIKTATSPGEEAGLHIVIIYACTGLLVLINVLLLIGNEEDKPGFFVPWSIFTLTGIAVSFILVWKLLIVEGDVLEVMIQLSITQTFAFFLYVVLLRRGEIIQNGGCVWLKWPTTAKSAKV